MRTQRESIHAVHPVPRVPDHFGAYTAPDPAELSLAVYEVGNRLHSPEGLQERYGREVLDHLVTGGFASVETDHTAPEGEADEPLLVLTDAGWALGPWVRHGGLVR